MNAQGFSVGRENDARKAENKNKKDQSLHTHPITICATSARVFIGKKLGQPLCDRDRILPYRPIQCHTTPCQAIPMPPHGISLKKPCAGRFNKAKPSIKILPRPARGIRRSARAVAVVIGGAAGAWAELDAISCGRMFALSRMAGFSRRRVLR